MRKTYWAKMQTIMIMWKKCGKEENITEGVEEGGVMNREEGKESKLNEGKLS